MQISDALFINCINNYLIIIILKLFSQKNIYIAHRLMGSQLVMVSFD